MPTLLTHPAVPIALRLGIGDRIPPPLLGAGILLSVLPDLDVLAFRLGIPYADAFGHRGFSHALLSAALVALIAAALLRRLSIPFGRAFAFLFACMASHGLLDTFTTGGMGIALAWPFSGHRSFAPLQVIRVSPLSPRALFSARGAAVLLSELLWVWIPCLGLSGLGFLLRRRRSLCVPPRPPCGDRAEPGHHA